MKLSALCFLLVAILPSCHKTDVLPNGKTFCGKASSYKDLAWLANYVSDIKKDADNIGTEIYYYEYEQQGFIEVTIPVTSLWVDALFSCEGKSIKFDNPQMSEDYRKNRKGEILLWSYQ